MDIMLAQILDHKRSEIARLTLSEWKARAADSAAPRGFLPLDPKRAARPDAQPLLVAEIKRASPSRGELNAGLDPLRQARIYAENGAAAISILTDEKYFRGTADDLTALRRANFSVAAGGPAPLLRKDFLLEPVQLYESRALGADAVLLIAAALEGGALEYLHALALELELTPLVEVHAFAEFDRALKIPELRWLGVNNRDLATFEVNPKTCLELGPEVPPGIGSVAESGIFSAEDSRAAGRAGYDAVLVGQALVTAQDPAAKVRELAPAPSSPLPNLPPFPFAKRGEAERGAGG
jgi:indole-3-glycerol phosphate synthase